MICTTVKQGVDCPFMTADGCSYNGGICCEIVDQCKGCKRSTQYSNAWYCTTCPEPAVKWKNGNCNMASHIMIAKKEVTKINPIKASKRSRK
jgi:hypothetical protein